MTGTRPIATACALAIALCAAAFAYASLSADAGAPKRHGSKNAVTIKGHLDNLQPGTTATLKAQVRNNLVNRVMLRAVKTKVGDATPDCPRTLVRAKKVRLRKGIPARQRRAVKIRITLSAAVPDACQDVSFPLKFKGKARRRDGSY